MRYLEKRYFEYRRGTSNKFWEITINKEFYSTRWGRIGTKGTHGELIDTWGLTIRVTNRLISKKLSKGYIEVTNTKLESVETQPKEKITTLSKLIGLGNCE